jgi:hypothetical protein
MHCIFSINELKIMLQGIAHPVLSEPAFYLDSADGLHSQI